MFYVSGGEWKSTDWAELRKETEERYGPFKSYERAVDVWRGAAQRNVDNALHRLFILKDAA